MMLRRQAALLAKRIFHPPSSKIINQPEISTLLTQNLIPHETRITRYLASLSTFFNHQNTLPHHQSLMIKITSSFTTPFSTTPSTQPLTLTQNAIDRLQKLQNDAGNKPIYLRLMVEGGGCSGFQYEFSLDEQGPQKGDTIITTSGVTLLCDDVSLEFLRGSVVDFESDLMRSSFVVQENPNAQSSCGCGSSFSAK